MQNNSKAFLFQQILLIPQSLKLKTRRIYMERVLVIYDSDFIYTERMMDYIRKNKLKGFDFRAFTDKNLFMKYMENHNIDLLVSSDRSNRSFIKKVRKTIYLNKVLVNLMKNSLKFININP